MWCSGAEGEGATACHETAGFNCFVPPTCVVPYRESGAMGERVEDVVAGGRICGRGGWREYMYIFLKAVAG